MKVRVRTLQMSLVASLLLTVTSCSPTTLPAATPERAIPPTTAAPTIASPEGLGPAEVGSAFYTWYLAYSGRASASDGTLDSMRNPLVDGAYRDTGYLTPSLVDRVAADLNMPGGGFDPLLCAQDVPAQVISAAVRKEGERTAVDVQTSFAGHRFTVLLVQEETVWRMDEVRCGGAAAEAPEETIPAAATETAEPAETSAAAQEGAGPVVLEGWQVYRNEAFRFQVGYPEGWTVLEAASIAGQPPIGPENLKLVVMLMPQAWAEQLDRGGAPDPNAPVLAPFAVEVTLGSEEAFCGNYPEPASREDVQLANAEAQRTIEAVTDEITIPRYIFQHPVTHDLRVVLMDPINGFADRRTAHPDVADAFERVANSFAWLD
jgi:hypothetical protein